MDVRTNHLPREESEAAESLLALLRVKRNAHHNQQNNDQPPHLDISAGSGTDDTLDVQNQSFNQGLSSHSNFQHNVDHIANLETTSPSNFVSGDINDTLKTQEIQFSSNNTFASPSEQAKGSILLEAYESLLKTVPGILMKILLEQEYREVLFFLSDNNTFVIENVYKFTTHLMKQYFKLTKFGCFVGKLERWGFRHSTDSSNREVHIFHHPLFIKGNYESLAKIKYSPRSNSTKESHMDSPIVLGSSNLLDVSGFPGKGVGMGFQTSIHDTAAKLRNEVNRCQELSSLCHSLQASRNRAIGVDGIIPQSAVSNATKDIVEAAIECLMRDEDHTESLLARRGNEIRQPNVMMGIERIMRTSGVSSSNFDTTDGSRLLRNLYLQSVEQAGHNQERNFF